MSRPDLAFLDRLADAADAVTLPLFRRGITVDTKDVSVGDIDPVTEADRGAELAMRAVIEEVFPDHGIAGEEFGTVRGGAREIWHLDPIDGTRQFITGVPLWGSMAGLAVDGSPQVGLVSQPFTGERFYGLPDGAFYRGRDGRRPMRTRACGGIGEAALFTTSPHLYRGEKADALARVRDAARLTRYGLDCYAFALLAMGLVDVVMESAVQSYDIVPIVPIIEAAGGAVVDWQGRRTVAGGDVLAVGDKRMIEPVLALIHAK